ncbi:MAG: gamma-glutamyltransferase family protein [Burkholderiaceae bacterium]
MWCGCAAPPAFDYRVPPQPEGPSGWVDKPGWATTRFAVAAANPLATDAGYQVLKAGGTAIDAAIAVQMVLTLVEPQSSGIGGGAFVLHWDGARIDAYDGRETAPAAASERLFVRADDTTMPFAEAVVGGRSVGVPGTLRVLQLAHQRHGRLPWATLFAPAIRLAEQGFRVSPRLHAALAGDAALRGTPNAAAFYFAPDGKPWPVGHELKNPALAAVLRRVAGEGPDALHRGPIAADFVRRVRTHATNPGAMTEADLLHYEPKQRMAICTDWRAIYRVCGLPPPSSGHLAVMQILKLIDFAPPVAQALRDGVPSAEFLHVYTEAARLAFADRALYVADPDFVAPPAGDWAQLLDDAYLRERARLIGERSLRTAPPGVPGGVPRARAPMAPQPESGTSHISIVDAEGRAIAMTTTIEGVFGSKLLADGGTGLPGGYMLNNELTDFSFAPADAQGAAVANRVQGGKRPRSSMSPTLVFDRRDGRLLMSLGSPGGAGIIHYTAKTLIATLDWGLDAQRAIALPNFGSTNGPTLLERGRFAQSTIDALVARGHAVNETDLTSGLQAIQRTPGGWFGGADPRREGIVAGD